MSKCIKCGSEILTGDIHWEMSLCNNCYNELYKDHKTHISLDKMWLELAQSFRDENEKLQYKIADLEAKLAESESKRKSLEEKVKFLTEEKEENFVDGQKYKQLEQQLALKEVELGDIQGMCENATKSSAKHFKENVELREQLAEKEKDLIIKCRTIGALAEKNEQKDRRVVELEKQLVEKDNLLKMYPKLEDMYPQLPTIVINNQDKISFCIEQLEKVKEFFLEEHRDEEMDTDYIITKDAWEIADYLLDQIKQLKEMK